MPPDEPAPPGVTDRERIAGGLLLLAGVGHVALGVGGIGELAAFEANVAEIEDAVPGGLYASLSVWGVLMLFLGAAEILSARAILGGSENGWIAGQISAFCGLGGAVFTLAIFRIPGLLTIPLGLLAAHLLARRSSGDA